ncbi:MAG: hypothetical protein LUI14_07055 [Lachnospiraceae bacterium]|nr:hypothetical protein [Lachnospiraceae bacterium]
MEIMNISEESLLNNYFKTYEDGMTFSSIIDGKEALWVYHRKDCKKEEYPEVCNRAEADAILLKGYDGNYNVEETIELDDACENHPTLAVIDTDLRKLFGDLLASGTRITETLLLDGYTGLYRNTTFFASTIEGKEIAWSYRCGDHEDGFNLETNNRKENAEIVLTFDRFWTIGLDDTCKKHPALSAIADDLRAISGNLEIVNFLGYDENLWNWAMSKMNV